MSPRANSRGRLSGSLTLQLLEEATNQYTRETYGRVGSEVPTEASECTTPLPAFALVLCSAHSTLKIEAIFLRNVGRLPTDYPMLYPRR
jgi:hypothetical protein